MICRLMDGSYIKDNVGHEVYNFANYHGNYYGYVETSSININRILESNVNDYIDDVLVIWVASKKTGGQYIVGWYKNARVYKSMKKIPKDIIKQRIYDERCSHLDNYIITTQNATLVEPHSRNMIIKGMGQSNIWYGNPETNKKVIEYIENFEKGIECEIDRISNGTQPLEGQEQYTIVKTRVNQGKFRDILLDKYGKCCLCSLENKNLLIASHIKPWAASNNMEKLSEYNGLLMCPNHDRLFDVGYITFDDEGKIIISKYLTEMDRILLNIRDDMKIQVSDENIKYIQFHRKNVFKN